MLPYTSFVTITIVRASSLDENEAGMMPFKRVNANKTVILPKPDPLGGQSADDDCAKCGVGDFEEYGSKTLSDRLRPWSRLDRRKLYIFLGKARESRRSTAGAVTAVRCLYIKGLRRLLAQRRLLPRTGCRFLAISQIQTCLLHFRFYLISGSPKVWMIFCNWFRNVALSLFFLSMCNTRLLEWEHCARLTVVEDALLVVIIREKNNT